MCNISSYGCLLLSLFLLQITKLFSQFESGNGLASVLRSSGLGLYQQAGGVVPPFASRFMSTEATSVDSSSQDSSMLEPEVPPRIKFKRLDKTARHIMQACSCSGLF